MDIKNLKDLEKLAKLCRKVGIQTIKVGEIEFHLGVEPYKAPKEEIDERVVDPMAGAKIITQYNDPEPDVIKTNELSEEELQQWSSRHEAFEDVVKQ